jgi:hypothetical protein
MHGPVFDDDDERQVEASAPKEPPFNIGWNLFRRICREAAAVQSPKEASAISPARLARAA